MESGPQFIVSRAVRVSASQMGNKSSHHVHHVTHYAPDPVQVAQVNALAAEKARLQELENKKENDHNDLVRSINELNLIIKYQDKLLLLGPKGSGKSTWAWLRSQAGKGGNAPKPVFSTSDGTVTTLDYGDTRDCVGMPVEADKVMRLIALLLHKESVPRSVLLFSQRPEPDLAVLNHFMISEVNLCFIQGAMTHQLDQAVYHVAMEDEMRKNQYNVVRHDSPQPRDNGFKNAITALFPTGKVVAPSWDDLNRAGALPVDTARATICRYIQFLRTSVMSDVEFINTPNLLKAL